MANNETFHAVALGALEESDSMCALIVDLDVAIERYVAHCDDGGADSHPDQKRLAREIAEAIPHAERFLSNLRAQARYHDDPESENRP